MNTIPKAKILVIEDQTQVRILIEAALGDFYSIVSAQTQREAISLLGQKFDLLIVDIGLPDGNGFEVCLKARESPINGKVPVIFLSGREESDDLIAAYRLGADNYLTKPFNPHVLREIVFSKLDRSTNEIRYKNVTLNIRSHRIVIDDEVEVKLTRTEFDLLVLFFTNFDISLSRDTILDKIWGLNRNVSDRTIDVHISSLRRKIPSLNPDLETIHGMGYCLRSRPLERQGA